MFVVVLRIGIGAACDQLPDPERVALANFIGPAIARDIDQRLVEGGIPDGLNEGGADGIRALVRPEVELLLERIALRHWLRISDVQVAGCRWNLCRNPFYQDGHRSRGRVHRLQLDLADIDGRVGIGSGIFRDDDGAGIHQHLDPVDGNPAG